MMAKELTHIEKKTFELDRRNFLAKIGTIAIGSGLLAACGPWKKEPEVIVGHNDFRYKMLPNWGNLDFNVTPVKDCHEMVIDSKDRVILLTNETKNNVIFYDLKGNYLKSWGTEYPGAHGLTLTKEGGQEFLFISDYKRHKIFKTDMDGNVIFSVGYPAETGLYKEEKYYAPTEVAVAPNGDFYVADGYGMQYILHYDNEGKLLNTFGGPGKLWLDGGIPYFFPELVEEVKSMTYTAASINNAHGICFDGRNKDQASLLVSSRQDNMFKRYLLNGEFVEDIKIPGAQVCRPVIHGENVYAAALKSDHPVRDNSGFVTILNKNDRVISNPGATNPVYEGDDLQKLTSIPNYHFMHPHDVCIDKDENIYVAQWNSGNTYPFKLVRV